MSYIGATYVGDRIPSVREANIYIGDINLNFTPNANITKQYITTGNVSLTLTPSSDKPGDRVYIGDINLTFSPDATMYEKYIIASLINLKITASSSGKKEYTKVGRLNNMLTDMLTQKIPIDWEEILDG